MPQVALVVDSTASLPEGYYACHGMEMVPYYLHIGSRVLRDAVEIRTADLIHHLQRLNDGDTLPQTACPGPGDYQRAFVAAAERASSIVSLHMTAKGTGAYQAAIEGRKLALETLRGVQIEVIDTLNVSMAYGWIALLAARAAAAGAQLAEVLDVVRRLIPAAHMLQTADTLRYLYMGGRIGRAAHLVGSLLNIRPIVTIEDGVISTQAVSRSREGALKKIASLIAEAEGTGARIRLALTHAGAEADAAKLQDMVSRLVTPVEILWCDLSPALIVHSGPGTVGVCYVPDIV